MSNPKFEDDSSFDFSSIKNIKEEERKEILKEVRKELKRHRSRVYNRQQKEKNGGKTPDSKLISSSRIQANNRMILFYYREGILIPICEDIKDEIEEKLYKDNESYAEIYYERKDKRENSAKAGIDVSEEELMELKKFIENIPSDDKDIVSLKDGHKVININKIEPQQIVFMKPKKKQF